MTNDDKEGSQSQIYQNLRRDDDEDDDDRERHFLAPLQRYSSLKVQLFFSSSCKAEGPSKCSGPDVHWGRATHSLVC